VLATLATEARDRDCDVVVVTGIGLLPAGRGPPVRVLYNRRGSATTPSTTRRDPRAHRRAPACLPAARRPSRDPSTTCQASRAWGRRRPPTPQHLRRPRRHLCQPGRPDAEAAGEPGRNENWRGPTRRSSRSCATSRSRRRSRPRLGGWDFTTARDQFAELELRTSGGGWRPSLKTAASASPPPARHAAREAAGVPGDLRRWPRPRRGGRRRRRTPRVAPRRPVDVELARTETQPTRSAPWTSW